MWAYSAILFLLVKHSRADRRSGKEWGSDELGRGRASMKEKIGRY
jgi:hypothetical protein